MSDLEIYTLDLDGCWIWNGGRNKGGYGRATANKDAHVYMFEKLRGPVPRGKELDHTCRKRACVNPDHLEPVTRAVNLRRGNGTKLTWDQVNEIRKRYATGSTSHRKLAKEYNVAYPTIQAVLEGRSWRTT
jgi:hypothetical protein